MYAGPSECWPGFNVLCDSPELVAKGPWVHGDWVNDKRGSLLSEREHQATGTLVILATPDPSWICHTLDPLLDGGIVPEEDNLWQVRDKSNR